LVAWAGWLGSAFGDLLLEKNLSSSEERGLKGICCTLASEDSAKLATSPGSMFVRLLREIWARLATLDATKGKEVQVASVRYSTLRGPISGLTKQRPHLSLLDIGRVSSRGGGPIFGGFGLERWGGGIRNVLLFSTNKMQVNFGWPSCRNFSKTRFSVALNLTNRLLLFLHKKA
jgi:hypothetical protein